MTKNTEYKPTSYFVDKWEVSRAKISQWFLSGRLEGAIKPHRDILIPINTKRPTKLKAGRPAK